MFKGWRVVDAVTDESHFFALGLQVRDDPRLGLRANLREDILLRDTGVTRDGNNVLVKMIAVRSSFEPNKIEVTQGEHVTIYLTNIEQTTDELHGFGLGEYNLNVVVDPGEMKVIDFVADKTGVFPYYCTNFCSALHQEMQGYLLVKPK